MVGGPYDRKMTEMLEPGSKNFTYSNKTLFNDLSEYTDEMKEATILEKDIYGNEIKVWSNGEETGTAELSIRFLEEEFNDGESSDEESYQPGLEQEFYDQMGREHKSRTFATQEDYEQLGTEFHSTEITESSEPEIQESATEAEDYELVTDGGERLDGQPESSFSYGNSSEIPWKNPGEPSDNELF